MLGSIVVFIHIVICILLVLVILMQASKGGGLAGTFGGQGGMGAIFGGRGAATFLSKITTTLAILFMLSCISQVLISKSGAGGDQSLLQQEFSQTMGTSPASSLPALPGQEVQQQSTITTPPDTSK